MDIDISDILADVSKSTPSSSSLHPQHYDPTTTFTDHQLLVRAWTSERCSPSLLPYPSALVERTMSRIQAQISKIEDLTSGVDYSTSGSSSNHNPDGGRRGGGNVKVSNNTNLILSIIQTDLSRTQFIVRSYLRQRLDKITRNAGWFLKFHVDVDGDDVEDSTATTTTISTSRLLSRSEVQFLKHHQSLLAEFYDSSFLAGFPENLRRLDDSAGGVSMVEAPDGGAGVVVRCLKEEWDNAEDVDGGVDEGGEEGPDVELRFRRGEVWVVRWRDVRRGVIQGDLECL